MRRSQTLVCVGLLVGLAIVLAWGQPGQAQEGICDAAPQPRLAIGGWALVNPVVADSAVGGLRMRGEPRTSGEEIAVLPSGTVGRVVDGPACNDGFWWWYLAVVEQGVEGWSAEAIAGSYYLAPTGAPPPTTAPPAFSTNTPSAAAPDVTDAAATAAASPVGDLTPLSRAAVDAGQVTALALSPDGRLAAVALADRVQLLNTDDMALAADLAAATSTPRALAFSPDGALLLAGYADGALIWWDTAAGVIARQERQESPVTAVAYGGDGMTAAVADEGGQVLLYGPAGAAARSFGVFPEGEPDAWLVNSLGFEPGGPRLVVGIGRRDSPLGRILMVSLADLTTGASVGGAHSRGLFLPDGTIALYGNTELPVTKWDPAAGLQQTLAGTQGTSTLAPRPGTTTIALGGAGGLRLYDTSTGGEIGQLGAEAAMAAGFDAAGGRLLALVGGEIVLWGSGDTLVPEPTPVVEANTGDVACPDDPAPSYLRVGATARTADQNRPVRLRTEPRADSFFQELVYQDAALAVIDGPLCADSFRWWQVSVSGRTGWTVEAANGRYLLIDPANPPPAIDFAGGLSPVPPQQPSPAPDIVPTPRPTTPPAVVRHAAYVPGGAQLAVGSGDGVRLYDANTFDLLNTLAVGPVFDFVTVQNTLYAVTWALEGIRLVAVPGGAIFLVLTSAPHDPAWAVAARDGAWLVLGPTSDGQTATLWSLMNAGPPATNPYWWPGWGVIRADFSPDGRYALINDIFYLRSCAVAGTGCQFDLVRNDFAAAGFFGDVGWSGDGTRLIGLSDRFWLWDGNVSGVGFTLRSTLGVQNPRAVALNGDGSRGAVVARALMELWNLVEGNYYSNRVVELPGAVSDMAFRPDGAQLVVATGDRVTVYDPVGGGVIRAVE